MRQGALSPGTSSSMVSSVMSRNTSSLTGQVKSTSKLGDLFWSREEETQTSVIYTVDQTGDVSFCHVDVVSIRKKLTSQLKFSLKCISAQSFRQTEEWRDAAAYGITY